MILAIKEITIPDIGGVDDVEVIELLVKVGDTVAVEDGLITLESDKASMDVPSPEAGVIKELKVKMGDKVKEGQVVAMIDVAGEAEASNATTEEPKAEKPKEPASKEVKKPVASAAQQVTVPDIGGAEDVEVIEVLVKAGDTVNEEDGLVTLESDKASMDVPSPFAGIIKSIQLKVGDKVTEGSLVAEIVVSGDAPAAVDLPPAEKPAEAPKAAPKKAVTPAATPSNTDEYGLGADMHASPSVRRIGREFGVNLRLVKATGEKGRITVEDVQKFVKSALAGGGAPAGGGLAVADAPVIDFSKFGETEVKPLNKIKKLTGKFLHRNWVTIPHVTQFDEADITEMEAFRQEQKASAEKQGFKLTPLVFIMKAVATGLQEFPQFNASLDATGENVILKKYVNVGIAVDTPNGLVVPVVRDVDKKGLFDLAMELGEISKKARNGKLTPKDMQGGCFSISSLGGIGGTGFTPIVNAPEVAILGVSKSQMKPVYHNGEFEPRLMLPLSLSYDHRVIDGADGARFAAFVAKGLSDVRRLLL